MATLSKQQLVKEVNHFRKLLQEQKIQLPPLLSHSLQRLQDEEIELVPSKVNELLDEINCSLIQAKMIPSFSELVIFDLGLTRFPEQVLNMSKSYWDKLTKISCSGNQISSLPASLGTSCPQLQWLNFDDNNLCELPDSLSNCQDLLEIYCRNNQIIKLPENIGNCKKLQAIYIENNALGSLPDSLGNCLSLEKIYCSGNQLKDIPDSINPQNCPKLQFFLFLNNPINESSTATKPYLAINRAINSEHFKINVLDYINQKSSKDQTHPFMQGSPLSSLPIPSATTTPTSVNPTITTTTTTTTSSVAMPPTTTTISSTITTLNNENTPQPVVLTQYKNTKQKTPPVSNDNATSAKKPSLRNTR